MSQKQKGSAGYPKKDSLIEEQRYRILCEEAPDLIFVADDRLCFVEVNQTACRVLGYSREGLLGKKPQDIVVSSQKGRIDSLKKQLDLKGKMVVEMEVLSKNKNRVPLEVNLQRQTIEGRNEYLAIARDISKRRRVENSLKIEKEKLQRILDNTWDVIFQVDLEGNFIFGNRSSERVTGYSLKELINMNVKDILASECMEEVQERLRSRRRQEDLPSPFEIEIIHKEGHRVPAELFTRAVVKSGKVVASQGIAKDITERRKAQEALKESEERYRALFERSMDWIFLHDFQGNFLDANVAALEGLGYKRDEIKDLNFISLLSSDQLPQAYEVLEELKKKGYQKEPTRFKLKRRDGTLVHVETKSSVIYRNGKPYAAQGMARDITEQIKMEEKIKEANKKLKVQAMTDSLTSLLNHGAVRERLHEELERASREDKPLTVIIADLDDFKKANDEYGHMVGDAILKETAQRIKNSCRPYDVVGRYGGEEFLVLMPHTDKDQGKKVGERIRKKIAENRFHTDKKSIILTLSLGVATFRADTLEKDGESLIRKADQALYEAKRRGKNRVIVS